MRQFLLAALVVCLASEQIADAQIFKRRRARQATQAATCPKGVCTAPGYGGLRINSNGGFEGQLPESAFTQPTGMQPMSVQAMATTPVVVQSATPGEHSILVNTVPAESTPVVQAAQTEAKSIAVKTDASALREAMKINLETMQKMLEGLERIETQSQQAGAASVAKTEASAVVGKLPILRVTVVARDGGEDRQAQIDLAEVARDLISAQ